MGAYSPSPGSRRWAQSALIRFNRQALLSSFLKSRLASALLPSRDMSGLTILIIGSGGREHALTWKLSQSSVVNKIYVCPGNGGTALESKAVNINLSSSDFPSLVDFALKNEVHYYSVFGWPTLSYPRVF